jgi:hypothetical protein
MELEAQLHEALEREAGFEAFLNVMAVGGLELYLVVA